MEDIVQKDNVNAAIGQTGTTTGVDRLKVGQCLFLGSFLDRTDSQGMDIKGIDLAFLANYLGGRESKAADAAAIVQDNLSRSEPGCPQLSIWVRQTLTQTQNQGHPSKR
jgi:hypothetical protein